MQKQRGEGIAQRVRMDRKKCKGIIMDGFEIKDAEWGEKQFEGSNGDLKESMTDMNNQIRSRAEMQLGAETQWNFNRILPLLHVSYSIVVNNMDTSTNRPAFKYLFCLLPAMKEGKKSNLTVLQFLHQQGEGNYNSSYLIVLLWALSKLTYNKYLVLCPSHCMAWIRDFHYYYDASPHTDFTLTTSLLLPNSEKYGHKKTIWFLNLTTARRQFRRSVSHLK